MYNIARVRITNHCNFCLVSCQRLTSIRLAHAKNKQPLVKDVTLYYHDRRKFFRLVGLACASQFVFWAWMAYCQISRIKLSDLRDLGNKKGRGDILDVSSRSGISWKIFRFIEVGSSELNVVVRFPVKVTHNFELILRAMLITKLKLYVCHK